MAWGVVGRGGLGGLGGRGATGTIGMGCWYTGWMYCVCVCGVLARLLERVVRALVVRPPGAGVFGGGVDVADQVWTFFMYAGQVVDEKFGTNHT